MGDPIRHVIFASYGNDSIALIQWARERGLDGVVVAYSDTEWAAPWWRERVLKGEAWVRSLGFSACRIPSEGLVELVRRKRGWPRQGMQFCTEELKIRPALRWLELNDPDREATCMVGIRREESRSRSSFPEWTEESDRHGGRSLWAPLVTYTEARRDDLIVRAGFEIYPHRSMECYPCINSNRADLRMLDDERVAFIEKIEHDMGHTSEGKPRTMFRPYRHQGAVGIREVVRWAQSERGQYDPDEAPAGGCDSGFCGT